MNLVVTLLMGSDLIACILFLKSNNMVGRNCLLLVDVMTMTPILYTGKFSSFWFHSVVK